MGYIYKITNLINDKKYIGKTERSINARWKEHLKNIETLQHLPLYKALKKYGKENFSIEIIEECNNLLLDDREIYWINYYQTYGTKNGYNCTGGGEGGIKTYDEEVINNIIIRYQNGERLDQLCKEYHHDYTALRKKLIERNLYIDTNAGPKKLSKAIMAIDPETKQIFKEYTSISEAARDICPEGKNFRTIGNYIGKYKDTEHIYKNFIWKTKNNKD